MVGITYVYIGMAFGFMGTFFFFFNCLDPCCFGCLLCMCFVFLYLHLFSAVEHVSHGKAL